MLASMDTTRLKLAATLQVSSADISRWCKHEQLHRPAVQKAGRKIRRHIKQQVKIGVRGFKKPQKAPPI